MGRRWFVALGAAAMLLVSLAISAEAQASSIFFIRNNNIWVARPDGSGAKALTTDGTAANPYDFVSSAKQGSAPPLAFHRGGNSLSQFGTIMPNGSGETLNPYSSSMYVDNHFFTRLNGNGTRMTWARKCSCSGLSFYAGAVGVSGGSPQLIYNLSGMDAQKVTFGDPAGNTLLFTDVGSNAVSSICSGTDDFNDVLALQTPPPSGQNTGPAPSAYYCRNDTSFFDPALRPDGKLIAAAAESDNAGSSTQIVTIPIGGGVTGSAGQSPVTAITPANSGDRLPDFSPDGTQLVFQAPGNTIDVVPAGAGLAHQILSNATSPAWSPYTLPVPHLVLSLSAPRGQHVARQHALLERVSCSVTCALGALGDVSIAGRKQPFTTRRDRGGGSAAGQANGGVPGSAVTPRGGSVAPWALGRL